MRATAGRWIPATPTDTLRCSPDAEATEETREGGLEVRKGREEIRKLVLKFHERADFPGHQHQMAQFVFEPDPQGRPDHWVVRSYAWATINHPPAPPHLHWCGHIRDVWRRVDGEWKIRLQGDHGLVWRFSARAVPFRPPSDIPRRLPVATDGVAEPELRLRAVRSQRTEFPDALRAAGTGPEQYAGGHVVGRFVADLGDRGLRRGCRRRPVRVAQETAGDLHRPLRAVLIWLRPGHRLRLHAGNPIADGRRRGRNHAAEPVADRSAGRSASPRARNGHSAGFRLEPDGILRGAGAAGRLRDRLRVAPCLLPGRCARAAGCVADDLDDPRAGPGREAGGSRASRRCRSAIACSSTATSFAAP